MYYHKLKCIFPLSRSTENISHTQGSTLSIPISTLPKDNYYPDI